MGGFGNTAEGYETMMLKDQFFTTCSKELRTFLKEKGKQNLKEMLKCAENYLDAHAEEQHNRGGAKPKQNQNGSKFVSNKEGKFDQGPVDKSSREPRKFEDSKPKGVCYICGSTRHKMKDCDQKKTTNEKFSNALRCWDCNGPHRSFECLNKKKDMHKAGAMNVQSDLVLVEMMSTSHRK